MSSPQYVRSALISTLIEHQRLEDGACCCGWADLGASYANHVATEYEKRMGYQSAYEKIFPTNHPDYDHCDCVDSLEHSGKIKKYAPKTGVQHI